MSINTAIAENSSHWYAIPTHFNQETRAETNLRAWNVESFFPKVKERRRNEFSGAISFLTKPFFPHYLFAKFNVEKLLHKVWFTRAARRFQAGRQSRNEKRSARESRWYIRRETNDAERVMILLETINYQGRVIAERSALKKVAY